MAQFTATNTGARFTDTDDDVSFTAVGQRATFQAGYQAVTSSGGDGSGDVVGPSSSVDGRAALFSGTTGKLLRQSSAAPVLEGDSRLTDARTPTGGAGGVLSGTYPNPGLNTESVQDLVGAMAGTGLSYDDTAGLLNATGGGATSVVALYETNQNTATDFLAPGIPAGSYIILNGQTTSSQNGLYTATSSGGVTGRVDIYTGAYYGRVFTVLQVFGDKNDATINADYLKLPAPDANSSHVSYVVGTADGSTYALWPVTLSYQAIASLTGKAFPPAFNDVAVDADYQATLNDVLISVDTQPGDVEVTLGPHATIVRPLWIHHRVGTGTCTVVNYPGDGNAFSITIPPDEHRLILPDGASWIEWRMPQEADDLPYTPTTTGDWPGTDPDDTGDALDKLAERVTDVEDAYISETIVDAKGDLIVATAADTVARVAVGGTNGHVLTIDSAETAGVKWAAPAGGGSSEWDVDVTRTMGSTSASERFDSTTGQDLTGMTEFLVEIDGQCIDTGNAVVDVLIRYNNDSTSNIYTYTLVGQRNGFITGAAAGTSGRIGRLPGTLTNTNRCGLIKYEAVGRDAACYKPGMGRYGLQLSNSTAATGTEVGDTTVQYLDTSALITRIDVFPATGSGFATGTKIRVRAR